MLDNADWVAGSDILFRHLALHEGPPGNSFAMQAGLFIEMIDGDFLSYSSRFQDALFLACFAKADRVPDL